MSSPHVLFFLVPLWVFVVVMGLTSPQGLRAPQRWVGVLLRGVVATSLLLIWAAPQQAQDVRRPRRLEVVFDVSDSILQQDREQGADAIAAHLGRWTSTTDSEDHLVIVAFGGRAETLYSGVPSSAGVQRVIARLKSLPNSMELLPNASNLGNALELASAGRSRGDLVQRLVFTDGACQPIAPQSSPGGVSTLLLSPGAIERDNFRLCAIQNASWVRLNVPMELTVDYTATNDYPETVCTLFLSGTEVARWPLLPLAGRHSFTLQHTFTDARIGEHELRLCFATADEEAADDSLSESINLLPSRTALLVRESMASDGCLIETILQSRGVLSQSCSIDQLAARQSIQTIQDHDLIILDKVAAASLTESHVQSLASCVRQGAGLLVFPGPGRGQLKALTDTALGDLLPLKGLAPPPIAERKDDPEHQSAPRLTDQNPEDSQIEEVDAPTLALLLLIDKSTSMEESARLQLAKAGAIATGRALHPDDSIGVVVYNDRPIEVVPIQPARNMPSIERSISRIKARGATNIKRALQFARAALGRDDSAVKVVILLSDGHTPPFDPKPLLQAMVREGITVHTVGVGSGFDVGMLEDVP